MEDFYNDTIILDINCYTTLFTLVIQSVCASSEVALEPWRSCSMFAPALFEVVVPTEVCTTYVYLDLLRWTLYRPPVGLLENAVLCCALFTKPYLSNDGAVLLRACIAMGMLLYSNEHLQISAVADRLSMFATCGRILWDATTVACRNLNSGMNLRECVV
jgi:hypothetical protein